MNLSIRSQMPLTSVKVRNVFEQECGLAVLLLVLNCSASEALPFAASSQNRDRSELTSKPLELLFEEGKPLFDGDEPALLYHAKDQTPCSSSSVGERRFRWATTRNSRPIRDAGSLARYLVRQIANLDPGSL
jgi:hypothetical protein